MKPLLKQQENASLANRAILVSLSVSQWDARRIDKPETLAVQEKHGTVKRAARVHKSLLPGAKELDAIHKYTGAIRTFVYKHTLPWGEGTQILKTAGFMSFTQELDGMRAHWHDLVNQFVMAYPRLRQEAEYALGSLFDPTDYPDANSIREKFVTDVKYLPVPEASDWRVDLGEEQVSALRQAVEEQTQRAQADAMKEAWQRLFKVVEHAHERLANPKAVFRDSLIENAIEVCALLPSLNIANDVNLEKMRRTIEGALCAQSPQALRKSSKARGFAAVQMKQAMDKMSGMYGAV